jgi:thiamine biosynthesis lipoprotein
MDRMRACALLLTMIFATAACQESSQTASDPHRPLVEASAAAEPAPAPSITSDAAPIVIALTDGPFRTEKVSGDAHAMGTHVSYAAYTTPSVNAEAAHRAFDAATAEIQRIESVMTTWRPETDISKVNAAAGKNKVKVDPETFAVVKESLHTSEISQGTFDITFESLHGLWKFDEDLDPHPPTADQVKAKLPLVGYKHVHLDDAAGTIFIDQVGTKISLGGIAKGYAVDKAAKILSDAGLEAFYVQAGGDLFARGRKPDGTAWQAGIRDPRGPDGSYFAMIDLSDHAFSTAGDYERSYVIGQKRYHHIIDPRTGFPATASRSVTIYAPTAYQADAIDDAVFILGPKKGMDLVDSLDDVGAVIVDDKNNLWVSKHLQGKVKLLRAPTGGI